MIPMQSIPQKTRHRDGDDQDFNRLGIRYAKQGKPAEAAACYGQAIEIKPNYAGAHMNLGLALMQQSLADAAIQYYRRALALKPDFSDAYYNLGNAFKTQGRWEEALENYRYAIQHNPLHVEAFRQIDVIHTYAKNDPQFSALMRLKDHTGDMSTPQRISLYFTLGKAYADSFRNRREAYVASVRRLALGDAIKHVTDKMPANFLFIGYIRLILDLETQIHRILDYCNLPWVDRCITFYQTKRNITTASDT